MKVAIIGAGACGLVLAKILENNNIEYTLFEKSLIGRKILASGNGKANIGNTNINKECYNNEFGYLLVKNNYEKLMEFYKSINLYLKVDEEGRIYPLSEASLSVLDCINVNRKNLLENFTVDKISKINNKYYINDVRGPFDYVVCASGSIASFIKKKQENHNNYLNDLNLEINNITPSLVGFKCDVNFKKIAGVRIKCVASLYQNNNKIYSEKGEVILKNDGISGICILNLSAYYARLKEKNNCYISLDIIPGINVNISDKKQLIGLVHPKLVDYFMDKNIFIINQMLHDFRLNIISPYDFEFAQVVSGGIDLSYISEDLSLKKDNHIFIGGEMLDIDGICGGYNLMFAFICGLVIGEKLCNIK